MKYDIELRRRALAYWADGHSKKETAEVFQVDPSTLYRWKSRLNETGDLLPQKRKNTFKKIDPKKLKAYIEQNPDAFLKEIAVEFDCSDVAILKALRRLKITRKKKRQFTERLTKVFDNHLLKLLKTCRRKRSYTLMKWALTDVCIGNTQELCVVKK